MVLLLAAALHGALVALQRSAFFLSRISSRLVGHSLERHALPNFNSIGSSRGFQGALQMHAMSCRDRQAGEDRITEGAQ